MGQHTRENLIELRGDLRQILLDKPAIVDDVLVALLAKGHVLLEDVPGVGKTVLVKGLAKLLGVNFKRIQFTPDLLPSDITGVSIYNQKTADFEYKTGPIMANIILADEINRTSPKTQSSLLEAMEEEQVTIDGETYLLPNPFLVFATQNPIEYEGTYSLPEAQLDRFLMKCHIGYPSFTGERDMVLSQIDGIHPINNLKTKLDLEQINLLQKSAAEVQLSEPVMKYIINLVRSTRNHLSIQLGSSPRGSLALMKASKAKSFLEGRDYVIPDDVKDMAVKVLAHRMILKPEEIIHGVKNEDIILDILNKTRVPIGS